MAPLAAGTAAAACAPTRCGTAALPSRRWTSAAAPASYKTAAAAAAAAAFTAISTAERRASARRFATRAAAAAGGGRGVSSSSGGGLRRLKGVGPANEELLRQRDIHQLEDLHQLYRSTCGGDTGELAKYLLSEVGIRRQYSDLIASEVQKWAEQQQQQQQEGEEGGGGGSAQRSMVTLAVEGNISAGKSTFLNVLSHEHTALNDMLKVVQEPVSQWQAVECKDRHGARRTQNVLAKFYEDPSRYAYSFQHYVLISRMEQDRLTRGEDKPLRVLERSIFSDRQVFVRAMHAAGTMEDFEVSVYNKIFNDHVSRDMALVPDGFVYLRASPGTCMQRLRKRSRSEEVGIDQAYLEMLHANHEDWLQHGTSLREIGRNPELLMSVLSPAPEAAAREFARGGGGGGGGQRPLESTDWQVELIRHVPEAIKDQVLLLKGEEDLPQLRHRLALVMDHDRDVDMLRDVSARQEYANKIKAFYSFVQDWKAQESQDAKQGSDAREVEMKQIANMAAQEALDRWNRQRQQEHWGNTSGSARHMSMGGVSLPH